MTSAAVTIASGAGANTCGVALDCRQLVVLVCRGNLPDANPGLFKGATVRTESLETLIQGGIAFATPEGDRMGSPTRPELAKATGFCPGYRMG